MSAVKCSRNNHDALARYVFSRPKAAAIELGHVLPGPMVDALDLGSLRPIPASTTRPSLGRRDSDLLFDVDLRTGMAPPLRVALDHQSTPDDLMPWRSLVYTGEQWGSYIDQRSNHTKTLPFVIPVLIVQPPARFTPARLSQILHLPDHLRPIFGNPIEFELHVDDLSESVLNGPPSSSADLALVEATRTLLYAYKNTGASIIPRLDQLGPLFDTMMDHFGPDNREVEELLTYAVKTFDASSPIHAIIMQSFTRETKTMYTTLADKFRAQGFNRGIAKGINKGIAKGISKGIAKGIDKGIAKGRASARAEAVLGVLEHRGLAVPEALRKRVLTTTDERLLQRWFHRAFTITRAEGLLAPS